MPKLNEQRIVKRRTIFPFNHEKGSIGWFSTYYVLEEWYKPSGDSWGMASSRGSRRDRL